MAEPTSGRVSCPACGKRFRWNPQLADRNVKCKGCQAVFRMPGEASGQAHLRRAGPDAVAPKGPSGYELDMDDNEAGAPAPEAGKSHPSSADKCPSCGAPLNAMATICVSCGFNLQSGQKISTAVGADAQGSAPNAVRDDERTPQGDDAAPDQTDKETQFREQMARDIERDHIKRDRYVPFILIAVGIATKFGQSLFADEGISAGMAKSLLDLAVTTVLALPILLMGLFVAAKIIDVSYGPLGTGLLKLFAILVGSGAMGRILGSVVQFTGMGGFIGWVISLGAYCWLISYLFDLDYMETAATVVILFLTGLFVRFAVVAVTLWIFY